jgi:hypothetical protein
MTWWLFTIKDPSENVRAVEPHGPEAQMTVITGLQSVIPNEGSSEAPWAAASVMTEVAHLWTICLWTESMLASGAPLVYITSEDIHPAGLEWFQEDQ